MRLRLDVCLRLGCIFQAKVCVSGLGMWPRLLGCVALARVCGSGWGVRRKQSELFIHDPKH